MTEQAEVLGQHEPSEAIGGYIECSCGWPSREQFERGQHYAVHIIDALSAQNERSLADDEWCRRCGGPNVIWSVQSPLWNYVMRGNDINGEPRYRDMVCMACFIICATEVGLPAKGWQLNLTPEPDGLIYVTPSGRIWDGKKLLWVEAEMT